MPSILCFTYLGIPEEAMLGGCGTGMSESAAQYVGVLYSVVRVRYRAAVMLDVETGTGRRPIILEAFARQSVATWA